MSKKIRWVNQKRGDRRTRKIKLDVIKNDASHVIRGRRTEHCERERSGISPVDIVNAAAVSVFVRGSSIQYVYIYVFAYQHPSSQDKILKQRSHGTGKVKTKTASIVQLTILVTTSSVPKLQDILAFLIHCFYCKSKHSVYISKCISRAMY